MNDDEKIWRCPHCETLNKGNVCAVCGEQRSITRKHENNDNIDETPVKIVYKIQKTKIWPIVLIGVIIIVAVIGISIFVFCNELENYRNKLESFQTMNHNAQMIYSTAYSYCVYCNVNGNMMSDGIYYGQIGSSNESPEFLGAQSDFDSYISQMYSSNQPQFWSFYVKNGLPTVAYWSTETLEGKTSNLTQKLIDDDNLVIGMYPQEAASNGAPDLFINNNSGEIYVTTSDPIAENIDNNTGFIEDDRFDYDLFSRELFNYVNERRVKNGVETVKFDTSLSELAQKSLDLMIDGIYDKDDVVQYIPTGYTSKGLIYEADFDLTLYKDEKSAAKAFFEYELAANGRELWIKDSYTVCYAYAKGKTNGASGIIVVLMKN